jgi:hypothetical protein
MDKVAALPPGDRSELFEETATRRAIHPAIVEKDFWVCWALRKLFGSKELAGQLVFKGGTSLSKVHRMIDRFSEDIDLVLNWELLGYGKKNDPWKEQSSNSKQDRFNKEFDKRAAKYIVETLCPLVSELVADCPEVRVTNPTDEPQVINIRYPAAFDLSALRPEVKLEIGPLASWVPSGSYIIQPYAAEEFGHVFDDPNCPVIAIKAERTFWEKVTILHQQAHRTSTMQPGYSRHYYDLYRLAGSPVKDASLSQLSLLADVVEFKSRFYRCQWARYEDAQPGTLRLLPTEVGNKELEADYRRMQEMLFGTRPSWDDILNRLGQLEDEINQLASGPTE